MAQANARSVFLSLRKQTVVNFFFLERKRTTLIEYRNQKGEHIEMFMIMDLDLKKYGLKDIKIHQKVS